MKYFRLINHINTAVALIDKNMTIVDANDIFLQRNNLKDTNVVGTKCFESAYNFNESCNNKITGSCPVAESFRTKKTSSAIHHFWIENQAVVEEIITTPIIEENGEVNFVVEEFRDITKLLGLKKGIIRICSYCRKICNEDGEWLTIEAYLQKRTGAKFSHSICDECNDTLSHELNNKHSDPD
jgi:transcriptional regulator with PAS, ATPase and Fis domain